MHAEGPAESPSLKDSGDHNLALESTPVPRPRSGVKADVLEYLAVLVLGIVISWLASRQRTRLAIEAHKQGVADQAGAPLRRFAEVDTEMKQLELHTEEREETIRQLTRELREERERDVIGSGNS